MKETRFNIFRYQIIPTTQIQLSLFDAPITVDELKARKNEFFFDTLLNIKEFRHSRAELIFQIDSPSKDIIVLRLGASRGLKRETRDFEKEVVDNFPSAVIVFNNNPESQKVAIEIEYKAFRSTATIAEILEHNLNNALRKYNLHVSFQPTFDKYKFWNLVDQYPRRITETEFRMISPNMSNISKNLKVDLAGWNQITNTQITKVALKSDKNSSLTFKEGDEPVTSFVDYSSEGGGNIKLRIKGISRKISTSDTVTEVVVKDLEFEFEPKNLKTISKMFKEILE
jgi:hypothetical protein